MRPIGQRSLVTGIAVADDRGTTYIFMGQPRPRRGMRRFEEALPEQLIRKLPGIDVRIVADAR